MVTRDDVAKRAGVSSATVSRVMNNYKHVSPEVRERVLKAMEELNYRPNMVARGLKLNRSHSIALLIPDVTNPYFTEIYKGIHDYCVKRDYLTSMYEMDEKAISFQTLIDRRVDGVIAGIRLPDKAVCEFKALGIPIVYVSASGFSSENNAIKIDNFKAVSEVVEYLFVMGHRKIGFITRGDMKVNERFEAYRQAIKKRGITFNPEYVALYKGGAYNYNQGYQAMKGLLERGVDVTAVIANNDLVAIGAMKAAYQQGLRIPGDISFVGFDDSVAAQYSNPPLTTVKLPKYQQGKIAAEMLFELMDGKAVQPVELETTLIIRDSVSRIV